MASECRALPRYGVVDLAHPARGSVVHQRWQEVQRQLALQRQAFTLITAPEARPVVLRSDKAESQAHGVLLLKPAEPHAVLIVQDLPTVTAGPGLPALVGVGRPPAGQWGGVSRR